MPDRGSTRAHQGAAAPTGDPLRSPTVAHRARSAEAAGRGRVYEMPRIIDRGDLGALTRIGFEALAAPPPRSA